MDPLVGRTLDNKYLIERLLGKGGMGSVYMALHTGTKRPVAVKVIAPQFMRNRELLIRFQREAEAAGRLRHPNVVNVTDFGVTVMDQTAVAYLVMEYLDGETLFDCLQRQAPMHPDLALDVLEQIALGISEAHSHGILHRDLKPQNIWLQPDGRGTYIVKVLDFGIAKLADPSSLTMELPDLEAAPNADIEKDAPPADENATQAISPTESGFTSAFSEASGFTTTVGSTLGTPAFMAPEQCCGQTVSEKSDLYSLAMLAYWMLAGELPFKGSARELIEQQISQIPAPPHMRNADLSESISRVILESLAKDPERRAPSPQSFVARLRAAVNGEALVYKESKHNMTASAMVWFAPVIAGSIPCGLFLMGLRFIAHQLVTRDILREFPLAMILLFCHSVVTLLLMHWMDSAATIALLLNRRDGEFGWSSFWFAIRSATTLLPQSLRACFFTSAPLTHSLSHIVLSIEGALEGKHVTIAEAQSRSAALVSGFQYTVISLWIRKATITAMVVCYIPVVFMIAALPVPVIWREYLSTGTGGMLNWASLSFMPIYVQFLFAWHGIYERGRRSLGESATSTRQVYTKRGRVGRPWTMNTRIWAAGFILVILIMTLPPFLGWNEKFGDTLAAAVVEGRFKDALALLDKGDNPNEIGRGGRTLIMAAVENGDFAMVKLLLERGGKLDHQGPSGTALHRAVITKRLDMLQFLLDKGANPNLFNNSHDTPLAQAAKNGFLEGAKLLLARGADPSHKDSKGHTPLDHAREQGHRGIVLLLEGKQGTGSTHEHAH
jgi:serine/threonine protein kinase